MFENWKKWIAAFERAVETDDWAPAGDYLASDVVYIVAGAPFACELRGRDTVLQGFRKSVSNFDRKFDKRAWQAVNLKVWDDNAVTAFAKGDYVLAGKPDITFSARSSWFFRDGRISAMTDLYDVAEINAAQTLQWLATHGDGMDPSYV